MRSQVSETSLEAYHSFTALELTNRERDVIAVFQPGSHYTRKQIAARCGMELSGVCGWVNSLVTKGVLIPVGTERDPVTRKSQEVLALSILYRIDMQSKTPQ